MIGAAVGGWVSAVQTALPIWQIHADIVGRLRTGNGLVLGNALTQIANLFNPPLPSQVDIDDVNQRLSNVLGQVNAQFARSQVTPQLVARFGHRETLAAGYGEEVQILYDLSPG